MNSKYIIIVLTILSLGLFQCHQDDPTVINTAALPLAGEWFVTYKVDNGGKLVDVGGGYTGIITSNTAANTASEIWVTDYVDPIGKTGNFWSYRVKATADTKTRAFSANQSTSTAIAKGALYDIKVNIMNGKVFPMGGWSKTKVKVDSIYYEIQFEDDTDADGNPAPFGTTYIVSGHKRTGFTEDEY